ncbi:molybdopterin-dependent oxidoreductase [Streptomyces sp. WMMB 322]|uniref:molybdopterin-dependent oxidoreductase n=1 Tax=Streptomyces sp. WMMB 322 TaxID=1286821 RepID=UPI0018FE9CFC|nr:molybdopterin-dependent oxidoreductase [Streptomyces sp. WMMB 322]
MTVTVNGRRHAVDGETEDDSVVGMVRDTLGLTGTKLVCGAGVCGACTVQVDGAPMASCLLPCAAVDGRSVTTVEGLAGDHAVQRAFAAHDALQCGYCTPGFVMEAAAFVDRWRARNGDTAPSRAEIADAMAGHLCRCGAYEGIYAAVAAACTGAHDLELPGSRGPRVEAMEKVTGRARYTTDVRLDGQLEGVIVRSTAAHAVVRSVSAPGMTVVDLLPDDRTVRYAGQPVAAVAAPTLAAARSAAARVQVEYDERPAALDTAQADAPVIYPSKASRRDAPVSAEGPVMPARWHGNVRGPTSMSRHGRTAATRVDEARRGGDSRLVSGTFTTAVQTHTPLEPHACVARWDEDGDLHLYVSSQAVGVVAKEAAKRWNLRPEQVHAVAEHVGGGFGAKLALTSEVVAAVELARSHGAPVRVVLDRSEELTATGNRPGTRTELSMLADREGNLAALTMDVYGHGGVSVASSVASLARLIYGNAPRRLRDFDVVTNHPPGTPFRGPGGPPMAWALEQAVDEMAHRLGEDPIALRRRWDGNPKRHALYDWAAALPVWAKRPSPGSQHGRFRRGVGVAAANWLYFLDPGTSVELTVSGGVVCARTTTQDMGTGIRSVIDGVVRAELNLPPERVRVEVGSTGTVHGPASGGSRTTTSVAPAARDAARRLRAALSSRDTAGAGDGSDAASLLPLLDEADGLRVVGNRARDRGGYVTPFALDDLALGRGFSGAVHVTEVEVDTLLGKTRATRVWGGIAVGHIYAEQLARSQCEGAVIQGIGYALYEQRHTDPGTGIVLTENLEDYRIPGIGDTPEIDIHFHHDGWDHVTGHGVGLGEVATIGVAASVGNAVHAATGWRPRDLPIRPDRLLEGTGQ